MTMQNSAIWEISNMTPYKASALVMHDRVGLETLVVVIKCTFTIDAGGRLSLADLQQEPSHEPCYRGNPLWSSLLAETDFVPRKLTTDVLLQGSAHAPGGTPTRELLVTLRLAPIDKTLLVRAGSQARFQSMPILYERAAGGITHSVGERGTLGSDMRNPAGTGFRDVAEAGSIREPNITHARVDRASSAPAGFGPLARHWTCRSAFAGTYDDAWRNERMPLLPLDFDERFYQCAPADQQPPGFLVGGEPVELINLSPLGALRFKLPRVRLGVFATIGGEVQEADPVLHTVNIAPDDVCLTLAWSCAFACAGAEEDISDIAIIERAEVS